MCRALEILREVCLEYGLNRDQIAGRCEKARFVAARRTFCHRARAAGYSLPKIGGLINRHHTTVIHHLKAGPMQLIALDPVPPMEKRRSKAVATKFKADYTAAEIDRMTCRVLGRAWD